MNKTHKQKNEEEMGMCIHHAFDDQDTAQCGETEGEMTDFTARVTCEECLEIIRHIEREIDEEIENDIENALTDSYWERTRR